MLEKGHGLSFFMRDSGVILFLFTNNYSESQWKNVALSSIFNAGTSMTYTVCVMCHF